MIKAASFDLDGTLIDSTEAIATSFVHTFDAIGEAQPPRAAYVSTIGHTLHQQFEMLTDHDTEDCVRIYREFYPTIACERTALLPGAEDCLRRLSRVGMKLGFATSKKRVYAEDLLEYFGILDYFTSRIGPEEVRHPKPHPEAVEVACRELGVGRDELFFVGDTKFDVLAARDAGVRCLAVTTGYAPRKELVDLAPEAIFDDLFAVADYVLENRTQVSPR